MKQNNTFKGYFSSLKKFPIGLNENLREEDNLSTKDNWPVPNVSFVQRFYCMHKIIHSPHAVSEAHFVCSYLCSLLTTTRDAWCSISYC